MKAKLSFRSLFAILLIFSIASCKVSLISKYDANVLQEVKTAESLTNKLYEEAIASEDKTYTFNSGNYELVSVQIASLKDKEAARPKSKLLVAMVSNIEVAFNKAKGNHRARGSLNNAELEQFKGVLQRQWKSLLNAERNLPK